MKVFNKEKAAVYHGGIDNLHQMIEFFQTYGERLKHDLQTACESNDIEQISNQLHKVKGALSTFAAERAVEKINFFECKLINNERPKNILRVIEEEISDLTVVMDRAISCSN